MRFDKTALLIAFIALSTTATSLPAQTRAPEIFGTDPGQTPVLEASAGYTFLHANAPPGQCGCFSANGGYGSVVLNMPRGFSIVADLAAAHATTIGSTAQTITVFNYLFGPRYTFRTVSRRFLPFGQVPRRRLAGTLQLHRSAERQRRGPGRGRRRDHHSEPHFRLDHR